MRHSPPGGDAPRTAATAALSSAAAALSSVDAALSSLSIGEPTHFAGLTIFPLTSDLSSSVRYILLADGLRLGLVSVGEVDQGGSVPDLMVRNRSDSHVLIVDGEELVGAKQNRIANLSLLVPAGRDTTIPVSCVEAGRWSHDRRDFDVSDRVQYGRGRAQRLQSVHESMRTTGTRRSDQGAVWADLSEKAARMEARSPTEAMSAIYERHDATLDDYIRKLTLESDHTGALFATGRREFGLDLFDRHETFAAFFPKLVRSYAIDAMERPAARDQAARRKDAQAFVDRVRGAAFDAHPAVALGHDVGGVATGAIAGALVHEEVTLHLTAFSRRTRTSGSDSGVHASHRRRRESLRRRYGRE